MNIKLQNASAIITVVVTAAVLLTVVWGFNITRSSHNEEQLAVVKNAVERAAIQCYSLEGAYPPNVEYLFDNYGVAIDRTRFTVLYDNRGSNFMPQITVVSTAENRAGSR